MLLALDVGNTNIVAGIFREKSLVADFRLRSDERMTGDELALYISDFLRQREIAARDVTAVAACSVVPGMVSALHEMSRRLFQSEPFLIGPGSKTGIRIKYDDPRQVGGDRICNAVAAHQNYPGPLIVVDFGTATTFDAIGADGDYLGGAVAPGILISLEALVSHAAKLSRMELVAPTSVIGTNTAMSMQSGFVWGYVGLVEGLVTRMRREMGEDVTVIATGGLATLFAPLIPALAHVDNDLTLTGIRHLWQLNRG